MDDLALIYLLNLCCAASCTFLLSLLPPAVMEESELKSEGQRQGEEGIKARGTEGHTYVVAVNINKCITNSNLV